MLDRVNKRLHVTGKNITVAHVTTINDVDVLKGVYPLRPPSGAQKTVIVAPAVANTQKADTQRWHQRLGHTGNKILSSTKSLSKGMESVDTSTLAHCEACKLSKSQRVVSREPRDTPDSAFDELHADTMGPITLPDEHGAKYLLVVTDAKTRYY